MSAYKEKLDQWREDRKEVFNLWTAGNSMNEIARMKNTTVANIFGKIKKYRQHDLKKS